MNFYDALVRMQGDFPAGPSTSQPSGAYCLHGNRTRNLKTGNGFQPMDPLTALKAA